MSRVHRSHSSNRGIRVMRGVGRATGVRLDPVRSFEFRRNEAQSTLPAMVSHDHAAVSSALSRGREFRQADREASLERTPKR